MSDNLLRSSLRQTHAYIQAYDPDLLRAIEADFREALSNLHGESQDDDDYEYEDEDEDEDEDEEIIPPHAPKVQAAKPTTPRPAEQRPVAPSKPRRRSLEVMPLADWHFRLPFFTAFIATPLAVLFGR